MNSADTASRHVPRFAQSFVRRRTAPLIRAFLSQPNGDLSLYLLLVTYRLAIWIGAAYRFYSHRHDTPQISLDTWPTRIAIVVFIANLVYLALALRYSLTLRAKRLEGQTDAGWVPSGTPFLPRQFVWKQIVLDTSFYSAFYVFTGEAESDFFMFFFVPIFVALIFLDLKHNVIVWLLVASSLLACQLTIHWTASSTAPASPDAARTITNIWLPRMFAFFMASVPLAWLTRLRSHQRNRENLVHTLTAQMNSARDEKTIRQILIDGVKLFGYDHARLWLATPGGEMFLAGIISGLHSRGSDLSEGAIQLPGDPVRRKVLDERRPFRFRYASAAPTAAQSDTDFEVISVDPATDAMRTILNKTDCEEWLEIPVIAGHESIGKLSIDNRDSRQRIPDADIAWLNLLATSAADSINRARLMDDLASANKAKAKLIEAQRAIENIGTGFDSRASLSALSKYVSELLVPDVIVVGEYSVAAESFEHLTSIGVPDLEQLRRHLTYQPFVNQHINRAAPPLVVDSLNYNIDADESLRSLLNQIGCRTVALTVMRAELLSEPFGVVIVGYRQSHSFSEDERLILDSLASSGAVSIRTARLYGRVVNALPQSRSPESETTQIQALKSLSVITSRIAGQHIDLDTSLRLLLTGVTASPGIGFSRALLFLLEGSTATLNGAMAVGARTRDEAEAIWRRIEEEAATKGDASEVLMMLLNKAVATQSAIASREEDDSEFSKSVKAVSFVMSGSLEACIRGKYSVVVDADAADPLRELFRTLCDETEMPPFACIPLVARGEAVGAMVVDNRFLTSESTISNAAIESTETFASVMAITIVNAALQASLVEKERLEAWRQFAGGVAHIIGTRVSVIENEVTRVRASAENAPFSRSELLAEIVALREAVSKAQQVLKEFKNFAVPLNLSREPVELGGYLDEIVSDLQKTVTRACDFVVDCCEPAPTVSADRNKLREALIELIQNAAQAAISNARIPAVCVRVRIHADPGKQAQAVITVADSGPGVPPALQRRIFDPCFTTKESGTGLGLVIVREIVTAHGGLVDVEDQPGERVMVATQELGGAHFVVRLGGVQTTPTESK